MVTTEREWRPYSSFRTYHFQWLERPLTKSQGHVIIWCWISQKLYKKQTSSPWNINRDLHTPYWTRLNLFLCFWCSICSFLIIVFLCLCFYAFVLCILCCLGNIVTSISYHGRPSWWITPFWQPAYPLHLFSHVYFMTNKPCCCCYSRVSVRMTLSDLEWHREIFNDTKHRAVSLRQMSFLFSTSVSSAAACGTVYQTQTLASLKVL